MKKTIYILMALALMSFTFTTSNKSGGIKFNREWKDVRKASKVEEKPIFIMVCAPWCTKCLRMREQVFSDGDVGAFYNDNFVSGLLDIEEMYNNLRMTGWGVESIPSVVYLDKNHKLVHISSGFKDRNELIEEGKKALEKMGLTPNQNLGDKSNDNGTGGEKEDSKTITSDNDGE